MNSRDKQKLSTAGGTALQQDGLFGALDALKQGLPEAPKPSSQSSKTPPSATMAPKKRGRVELRRLKAGKGGKTVTEIGNFAAISPQELTEFTFQLKKLCGVGGTIRGKTIELQGDQRDRAAAWLQERGFQPIMAGG